MSEPDPAANTLTLTMQCPFRFRRRRQLSLPTQEKEEAVSRKRWAANINITLQHQRGLSAGLPHVQHDHRHHP